MKITTLLLAVIASIISSIITFALAEKHMVSLAIDEITVIDYQAKLAAQQLSTGAIDSISTSLYSRASFRCLDAPDKVSRFEFEFNAALDRLGYSITSIQCKPGEFVLNLIQWVEPEKVIN